MNSKRLTTTMIIVTAGIILAAVMSGASAFTSTKQNASAQTINASDTNMTMMTDTNMMKPRDMMMTMRGENVTSSINLMNIIADALGSQIKVSLSNATTTAESSIGNNSHAVAAHLGDVNGYLVYTIFVLDPNMNFNTVIVDPGNGQVLSSKQISKEEHSMMHKGMMMGPGMMGPGMMGPGMMMDNAGQY